MAYAKPEVVVLGEAAHLIEHTLIKSPLGTILETLLSNRKLLPAYDLDE